MVEKIASGKTELWIDQRGEGPDVLLIGGLTDPAESWEFQLAGLAERYRLTAYDNRGAGRMPLPDGELTVELMVEDAVAVLDALGIYDAHVAGFSGGSIIGQEFALTHPERVRSLVLMSTWIEFDAYMHSAARAWDWLIDSAPSERAALEAFLLWVYTPRAHADGTVAAIIDEALEFPYPQSPDAFRAQLGAWVRHSTAGRLHEVTAPTLVLSGGADIMCRPALGRAVADAIPGALFEVLPGEAHQPFQEVPDVFNERVDAFWRSVEARRRFPVSPSGASSHL